MVHCHHPADVDDWESDSNTIHDASCAPSTSKQTFTHLPNLDTRALKPSRIEIEIDQKKASLLPSLKAASSTSKCHLAGRTDFDDSTDRLTLQNPHGRFPT